MGAFVRAATNLFLKILWELILLACSEDGPRFAGMDKGGVVIL
jgi:hypothetical protein